MPLRVRTSRQSSRCPAPVSQLAAQTGSQKSRIPVQLSAPDPPQAPLPLWTHTAQTGVAPRTPAIYAASRPAHSCTCPPTHPFIHLDRSPTHLSTHPPVHLSACPSTHPPPDPLICQPIRPSTCPSVCMSVHHPPVHPSSKGSMPPVPASPGLCHVRWRAALSSHSPDGCQA